MNHLLTMVAILAIPATTPAQTTKPMREVNITAGSTPGWIPSEQLEMDARTTVARFFLLVDEGRDDAAYAMLEPGLQQMWSKTEFTKGNSDFRKEAGTVRSRRVTTLTWTKDGPGIPYSGTFAALDLVATYAGVDRQCGYVILHQPPAGGAFRIARIENNYMSNATAQTIARDQSPAKVDELWTQLSAHCPNYRMTR